MLIGINNTNDRILHTYIHESFLKDAIRSCGVYLDYLNPISDPAVYATTLASRRR
jgi:hypothetical protein